MLWALDSTALVWATLGLLVAGVVKGTTGLGYTSCALPFLVPLVGLKDAIGLIVIPAIVSNAQVMLTTGHLGEMLGRFRVLYMAMVPGITFGLWGLTVIDVGLATRLLGSVMLVYAVFALAKPELVLPTWLERPLQLPVGLANGVVTGLTGSQVMPLFPYIMSLGLDPARIVQAVNIAVTGASLIVGFGMIAGGIVAPSLALLSILAVTPAMVGVAIGARARSIIPAAQFRLVVLYFLGAMGTTLALR
jgi:uncharacterized protein